MTNTATAPRKLLEELCRTDFFIEGTLVEYKERFKFYRGTVYGSYKEYRRGKITRIEIRKHGFSILTDSDAHLEIADIDDIFNRREDVLTKDSLYKEGGVLYLHRIHNIMHGGWDHYALAPKGIRIPIIGKEPKRKKKKC